LAHGFVTSVERDALRVDVLREIVRPCLEALILEIREPSAAA
jgi:hypothetical protein